MISKSIDKKYNTLGNMETLRKKRAKSEMSSSQVDGEERIELKSYQQYLIKKSNFMKDELLKLKTEQNKVADFINLNSNKNQESILIKKNNKNMTALRWLVGKVETKLFKEKDPRLNQ